MQTRIIKTDGMAIRKAEDGKRYLEGHFAVFNEPYKVFDGWVETIAPGAFAGYIASGEDTKVLWNHNSDIVLGSTKNRTASLKEDEVGLFGSVLINEQDSDAVNAHARVDRGDVDGCSFGFDILRMEEWWDDEGVYHTKILEVSPLYEVSPCTFPAYTSTDIQARAKASFDKALELKAAADKEKREKWREEMRKRLRGEKIWH